MIEINRHHTEENENYLGYDEDHDGNWNDFFKCPNKKCDGNNYIVENDTHCNICGEKIKWI